MTIDSRELANFETQTETTIPLAGEIPELEGFDIYGESIQKGGRLGGDHIVYVDFKKRYNLNEKIEEAIHDDRFNDAAKKEIVAKITALKSKGGILIADVSGHLKTDFSFATRLHDAFLISVLYEIEGRGDVTANLFRKLNTRLFNSSSFDKFITLIYGEISETGYFKFISAGHPFPLIFSQKTNKLQVCSAPEYKSSPPLAAFPSKGWDTERNTGKSGYYSTFKVNTLMVKEKGDILFLYTDGLSELKNKSGQFYHEPDSGGHLETILKENKNLSAQDLFQKIKENIFNFAQPEDDLSYVIIKKTTDNKGTASSS